MKTKPQAERYVSTPHNMIDSGAWKMLSDTAQALLLQLKRQWRIDELGQPFFILPASHVRYRWGFQRFKGARQELIDLGFIDLKDPGGIARAGGAKPAIYGPSERWREISKRILADPARGRVVWRQIGNRRVAVWEPIRIRKARNDNIQAVNQHRHRGEGEER